MKLLIIGGSGDYLLQALDARDLANAMVASIDNKKTFNEIFCIAGPDVVSNKQYYEILGEILNLPVTFEHLPEEGYLDAHPDAAIYFCHRVYDLSKLEQAGLPVPSISLRLGLKEQAEYLISQGR